MFKVYTATSDWDEQRESSTEDLHHEQSITVTETGVINTVGKLPLIAEFIRLCV